MQAESFQGPMHVHSRESETFYVLEGTLSVHTADVSVVLGPGDSFTTLDDMVHQPAADSIGRASAPGG
ncbi:cupin domain-containing protein [Streptomyces sp. NPDC051219]|uniref:cupin domain-containing protein n=1 Tax=Streptomyces sp. NPDC051219 TaxID=3155283 RepID=UPI00343BF71E